MKTAKTTIEILETAEKNTDTVYLLHFGDRVSDNHTTQHYIGYASDLESRIKKHATNPDARLMEVVKEKGLGFAIARIWNGDRGLERKLKNRKNAPRMCPICGGKVEYVAYS